jgi:hypothetical protein
MAHPQIEAGNLLCPFLGCAMPMILRKSDREGSERYRAMGEAYAYPIMKFGFLSKYHPKLRDIELE